MSWFLMGLALLSIGCGQGRSEPPTATGVPETASESTEQPNGPDATKTVEAAPATIVSKPKVNSSKVSEDPADLTPDQWRKRLTPLQYRILREKGTEPPWSGPLLKEKRRGVFQCGGCGHPLYRSVDKFESGTGWPSFIRSIRGAVRWVPDNSAGMRRMEVVCRKCGGHLGHVFNDGPQPTGLRHCINSAALEFTADTP